jgi:hypothetical protein
MTNVSAPVLSDSELAELAKFELAVRAIRRGAPKSKRKDAFSTVQLEDSARSNLALQDFITKFRDL